MTLQQPRHRTFAQRCGMGGAMPLLGVFIAAGVLVALTTFELLTRWF